MRPFALLLVLVAQLLLVQAEEVQVTQAASKKQQCAGMYSRKAWGGSMDPFILTKFVKSENLLDTEDPIVSIVIFEWNDRNYLGAPVGTNSSERVYVCDTNAVGAGLCTDADLGQFIVSPDVEKSRSQIITQAIHLKDPAAINYPVLRTGYYCISTEALNGEDYTGVIEFRNAYGELPAAQIAKLPFYGAMVLVYFFMGLAWGVLYYMNRHDILPVQNYITAILVFLVIEIFMTWLFYDYQNRHGVNTGAKVLLVIVSVLSAGRNSFSFFLLLIVCMGYGVVKPSLGKTMIAVRWLAIVHFVFGVIYAVASLSITPESAGPLILLVVLPLAGTLTAFYIWTLNSLGATMKDLNLRKQTIKAGMYRKLWWCILISIVVIFAFFFINSWTFAGVNNEDFVPQHWSSRWFILDGWLNLVYLGDVAFVSWVWRPTANNRRFAMSDEIAQDDEGFEIASMRDSLDFDPEDLEGNFGGSGSKPTDQPPAYDAPRRGNTNRDVSPLPAPIPRKPSSNLPRESLDGETMFAVGGEGSDSDEEDEPGLGESSKLARRHD